MRANEFVAEVGNSVYDVHHAEARKTSMKGRFRNAKIGTTDVTGKDFFNFRTQDGANYGIGLYTYQSKKFGTGLLVEFFNRDDKEFPHDISGTGNEFRVFSTVRKVVLKYLSEHPELNFLTFSAKNSEPSRVKLYAAVARDPNKWFPGFPKVRSKTDGDITQYLFSKPKLIKTNTP